MTARTTSWHAFALAVMTTIVIACGQPPPTTIFFPTLLPVEGPTKGLTARTSGQLIVSESCIWLDQPPERYLVIWPANYSARVADGRIAIADPTGGHQAFVGDSVTLGGGEYATDDDPTPRIQALIGTDIPAACRTTHYWVGGLTSAPSR